jgi:hypothetical protein
MASEFQAWPEKPLLFSFSCVNPRVVKFQSARPLQAMLQTCLLCLKLRRHGRFLFFYFREQKAVEEIICLQ